ncbi:hypothetical protein R3W88_016384 [Solanum pinnatisectum]|uniref:Uncharacterized protein n=1 Tax=Solanum pinnatisectum TaxID=50273 RepID=A0AAV9KX80_9SOLN|nr:hypothetical protein R3W88_016384 [Solanum pinnatisectum]
MMVLAYFGISVHSQDIFHGILIVTAQSVKKITMGLKMMMKRAMMNIHMIEPSGMKRNINSLFHINPKIGQLYLLYKKIRPPRMSLHQKCCLSYPLQDLVKHMISHITKHSKRITDPYSKNTTKESYPANRRTYARKRHRCNTQLAI